MISTSTVRYRICDVEQQRYPGGEGRKQKESSFLVSVMLCLYRCLDICKEAGWHFTSTATHGVHSGIDSYCLLCTIFRHEANNEWPINLIHKGVVRHTGPEADLL